VSEKVTGRKDANRPYVGLEDMTSGSSELASFSPSDISVSTNSVFQKGDVLFGKLRPNLRKSVIAPFNGYCSTDILVLRSRPGADPRYVGHLFRSESVTAAAIRTAIGTKMPRTSWADLEDLRVFAPHIGHQRAIAEIIDTVDEAILLTEQLIAKFQRMTQGLLHDLLARGLDESDELRSQDNPIRTWGAPACGVPGYWTVLPLRDACCLIRDGTHLPPRRVGVGPRLLSVRNIQNGELLIRDDDTRVPWAFYLQMHTNWRIERGDVLLAIVGATIGKSARVGDMPPFTLQRSVAVLRGAPGLLDSEFLGFVVRSVYFQNRLWQLANQTAQPGLYLDQLGSIEVPIPPLQEQLKIAERLRCLVDRVAIESSFRHKLSLVRQGLMDDLLSGRARVMRLEAHLT
jgi:type I restriction enzyme S subunit